PVRRGAGGGDGFGQAPPQRPRLRRSQVHAATARTDRDVEVFAVGDPHGDSGRSGCGVRRPEPVEAPVLVDVGRRHARSPPSRNPVKLSGSSGPAAGRDRWLVWFAGLVRCLGTVRGAGSAGAAYWTAIARISSSVT